MSDHMKKLRDRSGNVNSTDPVVSFLYILMRDHLPLGVVEEIMTKNVEGEKSNCQFTNGWLANYSKDVASRLKENNK